MSEAASTTANFHRLCFDHQDMIHSSYRHDASDTLYYQMSRKRNQEEVMPVQLLKNGQQSAKQQSSCSRRCDNLASRNMNETFKATELQEQRQNENHVDSTRRRSNSDSSGNLFDQVEEEDVCNVKDEESTEDVTSEPVACSVCGDTVAGFHCGAYVCEACKKFFVRCLKQDAGLRFTCAHNRSCEITKETRTQCPCCRFQKCLRLGMYRPGGPNVSSEISHIPCKVCGAPSSGFHFGAITCEGCKGFFRRTVKERDSLKYQCSRNNSCIITWKTRNICKMCRYRQCLKAGMKPDKSRIGRQPNSVKHATLLELNQIKSAKGLALMPFPGQELKSEPEEVDCGSSTGVMAFSGLDSSRGVTSASNVAAVHCNSIADESQDHYMELQPMVNTAHLKTETPEEIREDPLECSPLVGDRNNLDFYGLPNEGFPIQAAELHATARQPQYSLTTTQFNNFSISKPQFGVESEKSCGSPLIVESELYHGKYQTADVNQVHLPYTGIPPSVPVRPPSPVVKPSSPLPDYDSVILTIQRSYKDLANILCRSEADKITVLSTMSNIWDSMMTQFAHCAQATLRFAKKIPGFRKFAVSEQIHMVQSSMFPIVVVVLSLVYDMENKRFCYFMYSHEEMCLILQKFEPFHLLVPALHHLGYIVRDLALDETEIAFLCALHLMDSGNKLVYKELLLDSLEEYVKRKFGQACDRNGQILLCLRDMVSANHMHQQAVTALLSQSNKYSNLEIPQLFKESFIALDD